MSSCGIGYLQLPVMLRLYHLSHSHRHRSDGLRSTRCQQGPTGACADGWNSGDGADREQNGTHSAHRLRVLRGQELERGAGIH